ncbi:hypothetical protein JWG39_11000 [Desulforhopalus vacuolatus]|uniref:hypothetical protein n=1 Tax=Desulforhopalus vacuolatus TaxID=40414 RepID=UPI001965AE33|nr:hypothetical protein [Desulforhopalus vacuolatus]MBM9520338.1 hypothetical protein [Desulforhopalus vacuolatus]
MKLHLGEAWGVLMKTLPCVLVRIAVYAIVALGSAIYVGVLLLMAKVFGGAGGILVLVGIVVLFGLLKLLQRYVLYLIKAGHIAVITEILQNGQLPENVGQFVYGKNVITGVFKEVSVLFAVDQLVSGAIKAFNKTAVRVADLIPLPGIEAVAKFAGMIVNYAVTYVDETILSFNLTRKDRNIWKNAETGLVLYAQNWKPILSNAVALAVINIAGLVVCVLIMLIPFGILAAITSNETLKIVWLFLALAFGYGLKLSIINPFCLISTIIAYNHAIEGQEPNVEWKRKLEQVSEKFRELQSKAADYVSPPPA